MPTTADRVNALLVNATLFTGIDFIQVTDACEQTELRVFFLTDPTDLAVSLDQEVIGSVPLDPKDVRIYSARGEAPDVPVILGDNETHLRLKLDDDTTRWYLEVLVREPGDFTDYRLRITDPATPSRFDAFFNDVTFSFKAGCDNGLDCKELPPECPDEPVVDFPVDYLARDFVSLRSALLDFAAQRYPDWQLPIEADLGVMLAELMAALGDEFSYIQDRYNREAYLETATERRSLRNKARLLDHEIHDGRLATTVLDVTVDAGVGDAIEVVLPTVGGTVWAPTDTGPPVPFEVGVGFLEDEEEVGTDFQLTVKRKWNLGRLKPYFFDDGQACLDVGATEIVIDNEITPGGPLFIAFDGEQGLWVNRLMMLRSPPPTDSGRPIRTHIVRVVEVTELADPLFNRKLAKIRWIEEDALPFQMCIDAPQFEMSGNIVPAIAGETRTAKFLIGDGTPDYPGTVEREGPLDRNGVRPILQRFSLPGTETEGLGFRDVVGNLRATAPQIRLYELANINNAIQSGSLWVFERSLMLNSVDDPVYTLEDGTWRRIVAYERKGIETVHRDYATGAGYTIRFPDGVFGRNPDPGEAFGVLYRTGPGRRANVPAGTIVLELPGAGLTNALGGDVVAVTNPLAVTNGVDPESNADIRALTPEAYKAIVNFAVRPEDYAVQAERLGFVQRAQGTLRWTGSWHTMQVAVDPSGRPSMSTEQREQVDVLMECVRQAGREVVVLDPQYLNLDLRVHVCLERFAFPGQVIPRIIEALVGRRGIRSVKGFFHPDNFTFGTPLRRSQLEAAIHDVGGVHSVIHIEVRPHGFQDFVAFEDLVFPVASDQVIRLENDPLRPERGSVNVITVGGA